MLLAPLRGVTIRAFREVFAEPIRDAGFTEAITPFIPANVGVDPLKDRELKAGAEQNGIRITPQFIGKDPVALRSCLTRIKDAGYTTADLNCGCPYPMVRGKGRGSGLLRTPDTLKRLVAVGCEVMGAGCFSVKTRLGIESPEELLNLMPILNEFPLRFLTVHARCAKQMYEGTCHWDAFEAIASVAKMPLIRNGDLPLTAHGQMVGRAFIRALGERADIGDYLNRYMAVSQEELCGNRPVLGRMKELLAYWKDSPTWHRRWRVAKLARTLTELHVW